MDVEETRRYLQSLCRDEATEQRIILMPEPEIRRTLIGMHFMQSVFSSPASVAEELPAAPGVPLREQVVGLIDALDIRLALMIAESFLTD